MKQLKKESLKEILKAWSEKYAVLAPQRKDSGDMLLDFFDEASFTLEYGKMALPPKQALFPQSEMIFRLEGGRYRQNVRKDARLIFGIRSCDLKGLLQTRNFMVPGNGDFKDVYVDARARGLATVVMACPGAQTPNCFCTTTQSGPWAEQGYDLQFADIGDSFIVDIGSERGETLAAQGAFQEIKDRDAQAKVKTFKDKAAGDIPVIPEIREAMEKLKAAAVSDEVWERFGSKCITCGSCSFVCPTCTCFNVYDKVVGEGAGERVRTWDACLFGGFTKEASGHNPRGSQALRLKRRHEHKLLYYNDRETFGALSTCVGCGRCSETCPVHIGAIEVARAIVNKKPERMPANPILEGSHAYKK